MLIRSKDDHLLVMPGDIVQEDSWSKFSLQDKEHCTVHRHAGS